MRVLAPLALALLTASMPAHALLHGQTVTLTQLYPTKDDVALDLGSATVGPQVEFSSSVADYDFDIWNDGSVGVYRTMFCGTPPCALSYTPSSFNGFSLSFATLPFEIKRLDLVNVLGFSSFGPDRLTFSGSDVFMDFGGIDQGFVSGDRFGVFFRIVPEPGTLALFGLGLVGLAISRRRRAGR